ncbi:MAG: alpha-amylase family glycosyl hydrolase, partial [Gemmatimonadaceae bacterium]
MRPLTSTYRLQLNASFTLHHARERVPYLHRLGVSHLYLSPVLAARRGSTHGYDVADPTHVSLELGGDAALVALADEA